MNSYERPDGATMVEVVGKPHQFVERDYAEAYGLVKIMSPARTVSRPPEERFNAPPPIEAQPPLERKYGTSTAAAETVKAATTPVWTEPASVVTKRRGRPVGSKNKPKVAAVPVAADAMWPFDERPSAKRTSKPVTTH